MENMHRQGDLDGLCGIYSIVNSMSLLAPETFNPADLFEKLVRSFGRNAASVVVNGIHFHQITELLKLTRKYLDGLDVEMHFRKAFYVEPDSLLEFWKSVQEHHALYGDGSVLIALEGVMSHWSCIKKVHTDRFEMADGGVKVIHRSKTTIKKSSVRRPIVLLPNQAILIKVVNQKI